MTSNLKPHTQFFDSQRFSHPDLDTVMKGIDELVKIGSVIPAISCVAGPSRVGKSAVIEQACKKYSSDPSAEQQVIASISIEPNCTPKMIIEALVTAIGLNPTGNSRKLRAQLGEIAIKKGIRLFIIDELQHALPDHQSSSRKTQAIADILKLISDETKASILLVGLENTPTLLQNKFNKHGASKNTQEKQLFGRSFPAIIIPRIKLAETERFNTVMKGYKTLFDLVEKEFDVKYPDITEPNLMSMLWVACKGCFGRLRFLFALSLESIDNGGEVTLRNLEITYDRYMNDKAPLNPFSCDNKELKRIANTIERQWVVEEENL